MARKQRPEGDKPRARATRNILYTVAGLIGVFAITVWVGVFDFAQPVWNGIGVAGVAVTVAAVAAAIQIFNQQSIDDAEREQVRETESAVAETESTFAPDSFELKAIAEEGSNPDPDKEEEEAQVESQPGVATSVRIDGNEWRIYPRQSVPLFVIADLVEAWREDEEPGQKDGNWVVRNLIGAARRTGKGSHPWLVVFDNRSGERQIYRLYRGGRGNSGRNARNVTRVH